MQNGNEISEGSLDLRYLRYALVAAEHGSFRKAADTLDLSQSTVVRRIQSLEARLGFPLFERSRNGVRTTRAGLRFLREASVAVGHIRLALNEITLARRGESGPLRIGLTVSLAGGAPAELLASYRQRFPNIEVRLEEKRADVVAAGLVSRRLDVAILPVGRSVPGCRTDPLCAESIYVALPEDHPLAEAASVTWEWLRAETFLVMAGSAGPDIQDHLSAQLWSPGFRPRIAVHDIGRENLMNMVGSGFGVTLATASATRTTYSGVVFRPVVTCH